MSTTEKGDLLRDAVYQIVLAGKKRNCDREKLISNKAVDVYFEDLAPFNKQVIKYGVECKNFSKSLTRDRFDKIFNTYYQAKVAGAIDQLIIVVKKATPPNVLESINNHDWIIVSTFDEFCSNFMDFRQYLRSLEALYSDEGLQSYYVQMDDTEGNDIEEKIDRWVRSNDNTPQAILGGYGMGKTSLARCLASKYAAAWLQSESTRIPIYLKLGDIFSEQSLEGLVCRYFASQNSVDGFTYELFKEFNRQGLFLVILDGFDEMKYAMSFSSFKQNIQEFNQLVTEQAKVIILGRPNAFTSEDERKSVLHGLRRLGDEEIRDASMCDYAETEIALFNRDKLCKFIPGYIAYLSRQQPASSSGFVTQEFCDRRVKELLDARFQELISRPVHARMLTTIALSTETELASFSTYDLYDHFIELFLEREDARQARKKIDPKKRREFISRVAWERWLKDGDRGFTFQNLDDVDWDDSFDDLPREQLLRDLIIGSVLESKGDYYYFSHRSFQEFLVAEHLVEGQWAVANIADVDKALIGEGVVQFLDENVTKRQLFIERLRENIALTNGTIRMSMLVYIADAIVPTPFEELRIFESDVNPWEVIIQCISCPDLCDRHSVGLWPYRMESTNGHSIKRAFLLSICYALMTRERDAVTEDLANTIVGMLHGLNLGTLQNQRIHKGAIQTFAIDDPSDQIWYRVLLRSIKPLINSQGELTHLTLDVFELYAAINNNSQGEFHIDSTISGEMQIQLAVQGISKGIQHLFPALDDIHLEHKLRAENNLRTARQKIINFWRTRPKLDSAVKVEIKKRKTDTKPRTRLKLPSQ